MSLQVNLSSPDIRSAYDQVLSGAADYLILTYEKGSNDLKVQTVEQGSLDDALFDFSSGRMQYGFIRVVDPNSQLPKFVLINWCGEGVPESRKGLFGSHAATVGQYMKNYHVSINARREDDLDSKSIMKKVTDSSGSKYAAAGQSANTQVGGKIEKVGSSYVPVGAPDIKSMQASGKRADPIPAVGTAYKPARDELANIRSGASSQSSAPPPAPRPAAAAPVPPPAPAAPLSSSAIRAPAVGGIIGGPSPAASAPQRATYTPSKPAAAAQTPAKPAEEDRIKPVGTAYEPVKLAKPGKLGNRFPFGQQQESTPSSAPAPRAVSSGLTWSQRQEKAKQEAAAEEARSAETAIKAAGVGVVAGSIVAGGATVGTIAAKDDAAVTQTTSQMQQASLNDQKSGTKARAVYDFAASEDNELSFAEGEVITQIDQIDADWWSGYGANGQQGLFPSNCECATPAIMTDWLADDDYYQTLKSSKTMQKKSLHHLRRRHLQLLQQLQQSLKRQKMLHHHHHHRLPLHHHHHLLL